MDAAEAAMKGKVITEDIVETIPENVNNACKVVFHKMILGKTVKAILTIKQEGYNYYRTICELEINDDQDESINCSLCLGWIHFIYQLQIEKQSEKSTGSVELAPVL